MKKFIFMKVNEQAGVAVVGANNYGCLFFFTEEI
jgi:hypothetical protein